MLWWQPLAAWPHDGTQNKTPPGDISENRRAAIFGVGIGFIVFDSIIIALRIYARGFMLRAVGTDDVTIMIGSNYGIGKHALAITPGDTVPMLKCIWVTRPLYTLSMGLIKMSLLWFYLRLDPRKAMRWAVFSVMIFNVGLSLASFIGALAACNPPSLFWTSPGSSGCMAMDAQQLFYEVNGVLNIVTDILTYLLPVPMLYGLQLTWRKKGAILGIFGLGVLSIAAAYVRYDFVKKLSSAQEEYYLLLADSLNWCTIEAYIAIFCGCAPSLSVLIKSHASSKFDSSNLKSSNNTLPRADHMQRRNRLKNNRRRGLDETTLGSQDAIVTRTTGTGINTEQDHDGNGIMMKTDIQMDVTRRMPSENVTYMSTIIMR
ncbi:uncharacterized protein BDW70DRAFT_170479 [Aspergillus foveolatus]|uniref:uncharacterized protein n=1 Tax=Aspergillus foveolatus TaxID=210207 RepID=UPI003CCE05B9